jgi:hypothetical protein
MLAATRYIVLSSTVVGAICGSAAFGSERVRLAQTFQNVPPPPPVQLLPSVSPNTTCTLGCDSLAMNCLNTCVPIGPVASTAQGPNTQCSLTCTTQQLVCKQRC